MKIRLFALTGAIMVLGVLIGFTARKISPQSGVAFTIRYHDRLLSIPSGDVKTLSYIRARRADGSIVRANLDESGKPGASRIELVPERKAVIVSHATGTVTTTFFSEKWRKALVIGALDATCESHPEIVEGARYQIVGKGVFHGLPVVKYVREDAEGTMERWEAPDCACEPVLKRIIWRRRDGVVSGTTENIAIQIDLAEPDPELFKVPSHYRELPPSSFLSEISSGRPPMPAGDPRILNLDRNYFESRSTQVK